MTPLLPRTVLPLATASVLAGVGTVAYSAGWERNAFTLRRVQAPVLTPGARPIRVLHLSDIHMLGRQHRKQAWISDLARLLPDLVVSTGDNLAGPDGINSVLGALDPLLHRPGLFVLGSNDYFAPVPKNPLKYFNPAHERVVGGPLPWERLVSGLTGAGWLDLTNVRAAVEVGGQLIDVRGVDDPHLKQDRLEDVAGKAAAGAVLALALVHAPEPRVLDAFAADGADLVLSGHTHGGQLRLPGFGALVTNCGIDRARCRGLSRWTSDTWLHVSAGLGTGPWAPVRFACRPEATLLTLVPRD